MSISHAYTRISHTDAWEKLNKPQPPKLNSHPLIQGPKKQFSPLWLDPLITLCPLTPVYSHPTIYIQAYTTNTLNNQRSKLVEMVERYKATDFQAELSYRYLFRMMSQLDFAFISHNDKGVGFWNERTKSYYSERGHKYLSVRTLVMLLHPPRTVDCIFTAMFGLWMLCRICTQPCCPCSSSETLAL